MVAVEVHLLVNDLVVYDDVLCLLGAHVMSAKACTNFHRVSTRARCSHILGCSSPNTKRYT